MAEARPGDGADGRQSREVEARERCRGALLRRLHVCFGAWRRECTRRAGAWQRAHRAVAGARVHQNGRMGGRAVTVNAWHRQGEQVREPLHYPECGLDDVYLLNGYEITETAYGDGLSVTDVDGLRSAIAHSLATRKKILAGREVRFLRKEMDLTQSELGRLVGLDAQSVARWEKEQVCAKKRPAELLLRVLYLAKTDHNLNVERLLQELDELDARQSEKQVFKETNEGWRVAA